MHVHEHYDILFKNAVYIFLNIYRPLITYISLPICVRIRRQIADIWNHILRLSLSLSYVCAYGHMEAGLYAQFSF